MPTVRQRRIDLRAANVPDIEEVCKTIISERQKIMQEKVKAIYATIHKTLPWSFDEIRKNFPENVTEMVKMQDILDAQSIRWVYDECAAVEWENSDAFLAASVLLDLASEINSFMPNREVH